MSDDRDPREAVATTGARPAPAVRADTPPLARDGPPPEPRRAGDTDRALVARMLAGDESAFTGLVDALHGRLVRFAQAILGGAEGAEDIVQDTWLAVVGNLRQWQGRASLRTWIYAIAAKRARKEASRRGRTLAFSALAGSDDEDEVDVEPTGRPPWPTGPAPSSPGSGLHTREVLEEVERALSDLPPAQQAVIILCDLENLDRDSVCNVLGVSRTNRRVLLHRARTRVRKALEARFGTP